MNYWISEDNVAGKKGITLYIILPTIGCYRYRIGKACYMCAYPASAPKQPWEQWRFVDYVRKALEKVKNKNRVAVKIFTSGSFLDDAEVKPEIRMQIFGLIAPLENIKEVVIESRAELVRPDSVKELSGIVEDKYFEIGIGLETQNDELRDVAINKGNTFEEFIKASETIHKAGAHVKAYLLLKSAFLSEREAIEDAKASIERIIPHADSVSLNLTNVQKGTLVERLWERKGYRSPWLWSAVEILKWAKKKFPEKRILCDPVGAGSQRGPHNCGKCDKRIANAIREFSNTQELKYLESLNHECKREWKHIVEQGLMDWQLITW